MSCIVEGWRKHCSRQYAGLGLCRCECNGARPEIHSNESEWKLNENEQSLRYSEGSYLLGPFLFWCLSLQVRLRETDLLFCMAAT